MSRNKYLAVGLLALVACFRGSVSNASQFNYSILPNPIAYPYFEPGRTDFKVGAGKISMNGDTNGNKIDMSGGDVFGIARHAFNDFVAIDGLIGMGAGSGHMPGLALPFIFGGNIWSPVIEGEGKLSGFYVPMALNLEFQPIHKPMGSLILFGGPNMSIASLNLDTPYHGRTGVTNAPSTNFNTKASLVLGGVQMGAQVGVNLGPITVSPFYMLISQSGSATFTFDDGYRSTDQLTTTDVQNIEPFLVRASGLDIVIRPWNLSIGALIQSAGSTTHQDGYTVKSVQLTWHFRTS